MRKGESTAVADGAQGRRLALRYTNYNWLTGWTMRRIAPNTDRAELRVFAREFYDLVLRQTNRRRFLRR